MKYATHVLLTLLGLGLAMPAQAATFGGLTITPNGPQNLNLETGQTELPQGGKASDAKNGLILTASRMQFKPGQTLNAQNATVTTRQGGKLRAAQVTYDLTSGVVRASGGVTFNDVRLGDLTAPGLTLYLKTGFVSAQGGVKASRPQLSGTSLTVDLNTMQGLLSGPYTLRQGSQQVSGNAQGRLLLEFSGNRLNRINQSPDTAILARFQPYLKP